MSKKKQKSKTQIINEIKQIAKARASTYELNLPYLKSLPKITNKTQILLTEKTTGKLVSTPWRHFKHRGVTCKSDNALHNLYLVLFRHKQLNKYHIKLGETQWDVNYRFHRKSNTWEKVCVLHVRAGPKNQIQSLEKKMKKYALDNSCFASDVKDFVWGGRSELLKCDLEPKHMIKLLEIFTDDGFDSLK